MSDCADTTEFAGRILDADGRIVEFVTLSYGAPGNADRAADLMDEQVAAIVASLEGTKYRLVDASGEEVVPDE